MACETKSCVVTTDAGCYRFFGELLSSHTVHTVKGLCVLLTLYLTVKHKSRAAAKDYCHYHGPADYFLDSLDDNEYPKNIPKIFSLM